ncbi:iron-containing alcohol dehydrogenase [Clostridium senegalense]|uniref:Iron-containing alcohol dehydrogenase n=1 Tax=Clostridium senegalense TaxID=1465809 RepID=A0A6M0GY74_9CLOT|nr:iron-containing alcohol dehydrogenase [Clostridium senegalense]NEU03440.1 iron-containing alcohol dehydrogenase [Clostridium senegalense]
MLNFSYKNPTKLVFGKDTISSLGSNIKSDSIDKVLLLYGKGSIFKNGVYDLVTESLKNNNIEFIELSGVKPNPVLSKVKEGIDIVKNNNLKAIIAVGGGSVIDSAKAISAGSCYEGNVWDLFEGNGKLTKALPIFTVLTLSATGSEMNCGGVITNEDEGKKWSFGSPLLYPRVSILDPSIQSTLPTKQTVNGAVDTITHVFEAYFGGTKNTDMVDELSEGIIRTVIKHSKILINDSNNYNSRCELSFAATLALNGLNGLGRLGDWSSHSIEHSLSVLNDISHGAGLAIIMPAWMKYVYKEDICKFAKMGRNIFNINECDDEKAALSAIEALKNYYKEIGAPTTLKEVGVSFKDLDFVADNAAMSAPLGTFKKLNREDIYKILQIAFE